MDVTSILLFGFISAIIGAVVMLMAQYYVYMRFLDMPATSNEQKHFNEKYALPEDMNVNATNKCEDEDKCSLLAVNLILQFLFHELKHTSRVRKWFYRKLSLELDELITKSNMGRLFEKLTLKDIDLGDQFPEIRLLDVHHVEIHETEGRIENLELRLDLKYTGNFRIAVDAAMVLGKKASLTLKVKRLCGFAQLQFTRKPYTHWSLSFLSDPELELGIESKFQGRSMQSNLCGLISNQIRRAVRRKHTLPKHKLRYKPFFRAKEEVADFEEEINGVLEVKISELSRLRITNPEITDIYCTLTMASMAWVEAKQKDDRHVYVTIDVEIHKAKNQQIGILFKQCEHNVEIEAVLPNTPAIKSDLKTGDVLVSIEGAKVTNIQQVARLVKSLNNSVFSLRIERTIPGIIRNDAILEDLDVYEDLGEPKPAPPPPSTPKINPQPGSPSVPRQKRSNSASEPSTSSSTPTSSPKKTKVYPKSVQKSETRDSSERAKSISIMDVEHYQQHSTIDCAIDNLIHMDDICKFNLNSNCKHLNICVYGKNKGDSVLLGFLNIPVKTVIGEYMETSLIEMVKIYNLDPPYRQDLKNHILAPMSGFIPSLCFGDILMAFSWDGNSHSDENLKKQPKRKSSSEKEDDRPEVLPTPVPPTPLSTSQTAATTPKTHKFVHTHFNRATQCDYCGKKIWLKDAVQCHDCSMTCHKKCITKCQNATVCGPVDCSSVLDIMTPKERPELTLTEPPTIEATPYIDDNSEEELTTKSNDSKANAELGHRQSLTGLIAQGLKRVNSANNLAIPGISSPLNSNSKSLPPSPQHSPSRKQSLVQQGVSPFKIVVQVLESISNDLDKLSDYQINSITEPIINIGRDDDVMSLAKEESKELFNDLSSTERMLKINELLTKLRLALDSETSNHSKLLEVNPNESSIIKSVEQSYEKTIETDSTNSPKRKESNARKAIDLGKSEERVQALSVIMLYLCTGLQHAQGVAFQ